MASDIATGNPEPRKARSATDRLPLTGSRLGRLILVLNLLVLVVLVAGALVLNEFRRGLIEARLDSLTTQSQLLSYAIVSAATEGEPEPRMSTERAVAILSLLGLPSSERARLYDAQGRLIADTDLIADRVLQRPLPSARARGQPPSASEMAMARRDALAHAAEQAEVRAAM